MSLTGQQLNSVYKVLLSAFSRDELRRVVRVCLDVEFDSTVPDKPFSDQIFALVEWADRQGRILELVQSAQDENPGNEALKALRAKLEAGGPATTAPAIAPTPPASGTQYNVAGDLIITTIGDNAENVAVGKDIAQSVSDTRTPAAIPPPSPRSDTAWLLLLLLWLVFSIMYWRFTFDIVALWVGGWYKSRYFGAFSIPSEYHGAFSDSYFRHASWSTFITAISAILIASIICAILAGKKVPSDYLLSTFLVVALLVPAAVLSYWPFGFDPMANFVQQLVGSRDVILWSTALLAGAGSALYTLRKRGSNVAEFAHSAHTLLKRHSLPVFTFAMVGSLLLPIFAFAYLYYVAYFLGAYHGYSAIWEGRMNVKWAQAEDRWWIFVAKTDDNEWILYDRENGVSKRFGPGEVKETAMPVTRTPKN